jgi:hypothetical protein
MDLHRWLLAMSVMVGIQMMVMPSSIAHVFFQKQAGWANILKSGLPERLWDETMNTAALQSSQRQVNTLTLDPANFDQPHELTIETSANLSGQITINGDIVASLVTGTTSLDIAPYLTAAETTVVEIVGTYHPTSATITLQLIGPDISISHQSSGPGQLDYQLNLAVN